MDRSSHGDLRINLMVVPAPAEGGPEMVAVHQHDGLIEGDQRVRVAMHCSGCGSALTRGVSASQFRGLLLRCGGCGEYVETLGLQAERT